MSINHVVLGTGAIGRSIMEELIKRGESVRMVNRLGKLDEVPAEVEVVASDLYDSAKVTEVTWDAQVVYQSEAALSAHEDGKLHVAIGRGSDFFGPWGLSSTMGQRAFYPLLQGGAAQLIGRTDLPHSHTYIKDFGMALVILGERDEADGQAWHVPNDQPKMSQGELVRMFAEEADVEPKISSMGKLMMAIGGFFIPEARETVEMMYEFDKPFIVDSSKFEKVFGMKATPMREAIRETVNWYKNHVELNHG